MEIYTVRDGYDNIIEAFIVKELAEAYLAHIRDDQPGNWYGITIINTHDGDYEEASYVGREIHYGIICHFSYNFDNEGISVTSSLKSINNTIDKDDLAKSISVLFEVDKETYDEVLSDDFFKDRTRENELLQKAIDIYKKFKKETE